MTELKIGDIAPKFEADSTNGKLTLSGFKKLNIVLYFYPKDMTPGCTTQAKEFSMLYPEFQKENTEIIGVSKDDLSSHDSFCEKENIPYPLLSDKDVKICNLYGVIKEKSMFGKKFLGINRTTFLIDKHGKIFKIWKSVKPAGHAAKVLDIIKVMNFTLK